MVVVCCEEVVFAFRVLVQMYGVCLDWVGLLKRNVDVDKENERVVNQTLQQVDLNCNRVDGMEIQLHVC